MSTNPVSSAPNKATGEASLANEKSPAAKRSIPMHGSAMHGGSGIEGKSSRPELWRGWLELVRLTFVRQGRARTMVWLAFLFFFFGLFQTWYLTRSNTWEMSKWRYPNRMGKTFEELGVRTSVGINALTAGSGFAPVEIPVQVFQGVAHNFQWIVFFRVWVLGIFLTFLLPFWTLSFATEGIGGDRENQSLIWQLLRPMPLWALYLARWVGQLPWSVGMVMLGMYLSCMIAGEPGEKVWQICWPMGLAGAMVYSALFFWMGGVLKRPVVVGMAYVFFLELFLGSMPGLLKRASINFYLRCMIMEDVRKMGVEFEGYTQWLPLGPTEAAIVLALATVALLAAGAWHFSKVAGDGTCSPP